MSSEVATGRRMKGREGFIALVLRRPGETPDSREVRTQLFAGRARRLEGRAEASHRVSDDAPDQLLLRRVVVVQRRDVDADFCGDVARSQPLEAALGEELIGRLDECLLPFHQSDD